MPAEETTPLIDPSRPTFLPEDSDLSPRRAPSHGTLALTWQLPAFAVALAALALVIANVFPRGRVERPAADLLAEMQQHLDGRRWPAAIDAGRGYLRTYDAPDTDQALAQYRLGRAWREWALAEETDRSDRLHEAVTALTAAAALPLPDRERQLACLWTGDCLERLHRSAAAADWYLKGLSVHGDAAGDLHLALVRVWSHAERPDAQRIAEQADAAAAEVRLGPAERAAALLTAAETQMHAEHWEDAHARAAAIVAQFPETAASRRARLLLARISHRTGQYTAALAEAKAFLAQTPIGAAETIPIAFILADSLLETGRTADALTAFEQLARDFGTTAEGEAAAPNAALCLVRLGRGPDALARLKTALDAGLSDKNPWLTPQRVAVLTHELRQFFFARNLYREVIDFARSATALMSKAEVLETLSTAYHLSAEQEARLAEEGAADRDAHREQARQSFVLAGDAYADLAEATKSEPAYVDRLWSAAEAYRAAQAYDRAGRTLERFIQVSFVPGVAQGARYTQAYYGLAEAYAATGRPNEAIEAFRRIVQESPNHACAYESRLAWGQCALQVGKLEEAEAVFSGIVENKDGDTFTPRSIIWRKALFLLGETLHRRGRELDAARRLTEAVARYPDEPEAQHGRYLLGECYRMSALSLDARLRSDTRPTVRAAMLAERTRRLSEAAVFYGQVIEHAETLAAQQRPLDGLDEVERRNSYFFRGDCYFEMGQYGQAIAAYDRAAQQFKSDPRSVPAFVQMAEALRRDQKKDLAKVAVEKARLALRNVPGDDLEKRPVGMTREQWTAWLDWAGRME